MNPILIVFSAAVVLSALSIALINKPRIPVVAGSFLLVLIFFVVTTFFRFVVMKDRPTYEDLETAFSIFSYVDIGLFLASLFAMFTETLTILHQNSKVRGK